VTTHATIRRPRPRPTTPAAPTGGAERVRELAAAEIAAEAHASRWRAPWQATYDRGVRDGVLLALARLQDRPLDQVYADLTKEHPTR
jgi:hypothetical protein